MSARPLGSLTYSRFLILIAGLGGLLYGIDIGIIAAALLYLGKTVSLSITQTSLIVAAVLGGSMASSLIGGLLSDWFGRRRMMIVSGLMFVASVGLIVLSNGFTMLFLGRVLQGMSGGVIAVVVPLYLAECLGPNHRGRGTAIFQWMLTFGILVASLAGLVYTWRAEAAIAAAAGNEVLIRAAQNHAWRSMFLSMIVPGLLFSIGSIFLVETPRWLFRKGRRAEALASLRRLGPQSEAELQIVEMEAQVEGQVREISPKWGGSLLQRKYVVPFLLACVVLACNQATGINSVLAFLVLILKQAGLSAGLATQGDVVVKGINCLMTLIAVLLVDRKGRKFLLKIGTGGIVVSLVAAGILFRTFEVQRVDVHAQAQRAISADTLRLPISEVIPAHKESEPVLALTVLYSYGDGDRVATALTTDRDPVVIIEPNVKDVGKPLTIRRAFYAPVAGERTGWLIMLCLALFVSFFAIGPGVVVWLALSELMPTRIRSTGMGVALLLNQGVSTLIAALFLPVVGNFGFYAIFFFWAACTLVYFATATFFLPETKGKTLEEIETSFG
jgi:SP family myo-inositol transporter-like MFS transporter 13